MPALVDQSARDVPATAPRLTATDVAVAGLDPAWTVESDELRRRYTFSDFAGAVAFVAALGPIADADDHHPELLVAWGRVDVRLTTHDVGGLSQRDLIVAAKLDRLFAISAR